MNGQKDFLQILIKKLDQHEIPYMLSGSVSSSLHGHPRATKDVDIIIEPTEKQLFSFVESLGEDYYVSIEAVRNAFADKSMFNIIDKETSWKADFIIRKDRPFSHQEFKRKRTTKIEGLKVWVTSPEDIILSKLEWAKNSHSEQQFRDALGVAVTQWNILELDYLHYWAKQLKLKSSLEELLEQAKKLLEST